MVGYTSVRVQATREAIQQAEQHYSDIREGRNKRLYLDKGRVRQRGLVARIRRMRLDTIRAKLVGMVFIAAVLLVASGGLGLYGLNIAGERLDQLNNDGLRDVIRLQQIDQTIAQTRQSMIEPERMELISQRFDMGDAVAESAGQVTDEWQAYYSRDVNATPLASQFDEQLQAFLENGMRQAVNVLQAEETYQAFTGLDAVIRVMNEDGRALSSLVNELIAQKQATAEAMATEAERGQTVMLSAQMGVLGTGLLLLVLISLLTLRSITRPLKQASRFTLQIAGVISRPECRPSGAMKLASLWMPWTPCAKAWAASLARSRQALMWSRRRPSKLPAVTKRFLHARSSRRHRCNRPRPAWRK